MVLGCVFRLLKWTIIIAVLVFLIHFWVSSKDYLMSEKAMEEIAKKHVGTNNVEKAFDEIHKEFQRKYPGHILPKEDLQWVFMNAGGWMGAVCIIHASLTEYVLFFGSVMEMSGHSGRYWINVTDTFLTGEFHQWKEGTLKTTVHKAGDTVKHAWGEVAGVNMKAGTFAVEYGRGFIPSSLGFALGDTIFSTQDFVTLFYTTKVYVKALLLEAGYYIAHPNEIFG